MPGKRAVSTKYAPATVAHCETVCRGFYAYHLEAGTGPIMNPFPLARPGRSHAHHNPMDPFPRQKSGLFRPRVPRRVPKQIPDSVFNELFARLPSHRDRALVAFWVSTGARASELLGAVCPGADPGQQLITVTRKGSRAVQQLPASPDAFVWLRLYQQEMHGLVPSGPGDPLWWTLRRPFRPLAYHAARAMFDRANAAIGAGWSLHSLRHTAAYRLARDPGVPISDVQWVLGHHSLATTQIYVVPTAEDVIESTLSHHRRRAGPKPASTSGADARLPAREPGRAVREGPLVTAAVSARAVSRPWQLSAEALAVMEKFPPRPVPPSWDATAADRSAVVRRMLAPPFPAGDAKCRYSRKLAVLKILDWLQLHPGTTWQERWIASGAGTGGNADWRDRMLDDLAAADALGPRGRQIRNVLGLGMVQLIGGDVLRPGLPWLLATASPVRVAEEMGRTRDPAGVAMLKELRETSTVGKSTFAPAIERSALIMAAKGGLVSDITPGDCMQLLDCCRQVFSDGTRTNRHSSFVYQLLHSAGIFPPGAPASGPDDQHPVPRPAHRRGTRGPV